MKLNRDMQRQILEALAGAYPEPVFNVLKDLDLEPVDGIANLLYLAEHKLVSAKFARFSGESTSLNGSQTITATGLDFLADDGGVSAILGTVTIKFHEETLRQLIEVRVAQSGLPEADKKPLLQAVRELPADSIKHLTTRLLDLGMENLPRAAELIRTALF